jgi:hypothetical protein
LLLGKAALFVVTAFEGYPATKVVARLDMSPMHSRVSLAGDVAPELLEAAGEGILPGVTPRPPWERFEFAL